VWSAVYKIHLNLSEAKIIRANCLVAYVTRERERETKSSVAKNTASVAGTSLHFPQNMTHR
jgi:hypothetical protein